MHIPTDSATGKIEHVQLLHAWFSPAMPTGAYTFSHGLEAAIAQHHVHDAQTLANWIERVLSRGSGFNDACLLAAAWRAEHRHDRDELDHVEAVANALVASRERLQESLVQGQAFARAAAAWVDIDTADQRRTLSVTVGCLSARAGLPLSMTLVAATQAFLSNLVWIGARLVPVGQQQALEIVSQSLAVVRATADKASSSTLDDIGSASPMADIASIQHETLVSRVCAS